jgi:hypothetical protein
MAFTLTGFSRTVRSYSLLTVATLRNTSSELNGSRKEIARPEAISSPPVNSAASRLQAVNRFEKDLLVM